MSAIHHTSKLLGIASLVLATFLVQIPVQAQAQADPPGRVARVTYGYGNLTFADAGSNEWIALTPNRPLSSGDSLFVPPMGRAELHIGSTALRLHEKTRIGFITLTDDSTQINLSQGSVLLRVRNLYEKEILEVNTPNLIFTIQEAGEYRLNLNDDNTTTVMVRRGSGVAQGDRDIVTLREGEQSRFIGTNLNHTQIARVPSVDTFDQWAFDRDRAEDNSISARYVSREVIGYQQLDEYGVWETNREYGSIWYPRNVASSWAPYRDGSWVWVAPWGWTWVDRAPWGFAPYHYGRWAQIGVRWAWVPGRDHHRYRPVYAPALVAFVGGGTVGFNASISIGSGRAHHNGPAVGWFPLAPGERYHPSYTNNSRYLSNVNQTVITNTTIVHNNNYAYVNQRRAITAVPTTTFIRGEHVMPASGSILSGQIRQLQAASQAVTQAPTLMPERNNRFGEYRDRDRNWQENDQFRHRPVVSVSQSPQMNVQRNMQANAPLNVPNNSVNGNNAVQSGTPNNMSRRGDRGESIMGGSNEHTVIRHDNRGGNTAAIPSAFPVAEVAMQSRRMDANDRMQRGNPPVITTNEIHPTAPVNAPVANNSSSGIIAGQIRMVEEMNNNRSRSMNRGDRFDDDGARINSNARIVSAPPNMPAQAPTQAVSRPIETRQAEPRMNERSMERRNDRGAEMTVERPAPPAQQMQQQAMPQAPRVEQRPVPAEVRPPATVAKPEREKEKDKESRNNGRNGMER